MLTRAPWTPLRGWTAAGAAVSTVTVVGSAIASLAYTGRIATGPLHWLAVALAGVCAVGYITASIRDQLAGRMEHLEELVADYGDRREITGQQTGARVTTGRRLGTVD